MNNLFVPYELALKLKEKGFDEPCFAYYDEEDGGQDVYEYANCTGNVTGNKACYNDDFLSVTNSQLDKYGAFCSKDENDEDSFSRFAAPLYQQVIDWFLHKHSVFINIEYSMVVPYYRQHEFECEKVPMCYVYNIIKIGEFSEDCELIVSNLNEDRPQFSNYYESLNKAIEEALTLIP